MRQPSRLPCGPVRDMLQALADPQTVARNMVVEVPRTRLDRVRTLGIPVKFSQTLGKIQTGALIYSEHSHEIQPECGFGADEITTFEQEGALMCAARDGSTRRARKAQR